ncbi:hypothetical protein J5T34_04785 [Cupriavidus gilardii]|uniref:hypothetical protein n=1 Tax=Cupriavidus gilardii TaxID=82541 RepID=UPI001ABE83CD|nr:hypothetical protein [Cupriavidus gilardii]MBO4120053.1 hypothetical protein [Cupriavidus gilardii]
MPGESRIQQRAKAFVDIAHIDIPFPEFPKTGSSNIQQMGMDLAASAHALFFTQGCRIEFAGKHDSNTDRQVRSLMQSAAPDSPEDAGARLLEFIQGELQSQLVEGGQLWHPGHAAVLAATLGQRAIWNAEGEALARIFHERGFGLHARPTEITMRISPLADGSGWRINKLMNWYSYRDETGKTRCMSTLNPILEIDHQIDVYFDSAHTTIRNAWNWLTGRETTEFKAGIRTEIGQIAWRDPHLDVPMLAHGPSDRPRGLSSIISALFEAIAQAFANAFEEGCRRVDGAAFKPLSGQERNAFLMHRPHSLYGPRDNAALESDDNALAASEALDPNLAALAPTRAMLLHRLERGDGDLQRVGDVPGVLRSFAARKLDKQDNGTAQFVIIPANGNEQLHRRTGPRRTDLHYPASAALSAGRGTHRQRPAAAPAVANEQVLRAEAAARQLRNIPRIDASVAPPLPGSPASTSNGAEAANRPPEEPIGAPAEQRGLDSPSADGSRADLPPASSRSDVVTHRNGEPQLAATVTGSP